MNKISLYSVLLSIFVGALLQTVPATAQTMPSLLVGSDPAAAGRAGVQFGATAFAPQDDAAAMALSSDRLSAGASFGLWQPSAAGDKVVGASAFYKITDRLALGAFGKFFFQNEYEITNDNGVVSQVNGTFTPKENSFGLSGAFEVVKGLSVGAGFRMATSQLGPETKGNAFAADISARYVNKGLQVGAAVCNLGTKVKYGESAYALPALVRVGGSYSIVGITAGAQVEYLFSGALMASFAAEYAWKDMVFARAGYHYGPADKAVPSYASLGLGARFFGVSLQAAWLFASPTLGNSLSFGLGYAF